MVRSGFFTWGEVALLIGIFAVLVSSDAFVPVSRHVSTIVRVAILPICNFGQACEPELPALLQSLYFKNSQGVASFASEISRGQIRVNGIVTPWLRPMKKLRNTNDVLTRSEQLLELARPYLVPDAYDVMVFYTNITGDNTSYAKPRGQVLLVDDQEINPALNLLVNIPIFATSQPGKTDSSILPSTAWAKALFEALELNSDTPILRCFEQSNIEQCRILPNPYSLFGNHRFALHVPSYDLRTRGHMSTPIQHLAADDVYTLSHRSHHHPSSLEITLDPPLTLNSSTQFDRLFIEAKNFNYFDRKLTRLSQRQQQKFSTMLFNPPTAALIFLTDSKNHRSYLVDTSSYAHSDVDNRSAGAPLVRGHRYQLVGSKLVLEILDDSFSKINIRITGLAKK